MGNRETIASVPIDVTDAQTLRMFLLKFIERLDVLLGYRGDFDIVSSEAIFGPGGITETIDELSKQIQETNRRAQRQAKPVQLDFTELGEAEEEYNVEQMQAVITAITELQEAAKAMSKNLRDAGFVVVMPVSEGG